jgi:hypothetical protein
VNLQASDFPSAGWTSTPASTPSVGATDPQTAALYSCLHLPIAARVEVSETPSPAFSSGPTLTAGSDVTELSSSAVVAAEVAALEAPDGLTCLGRTIGGAVASQGVAVSGAAIRPLPTPVTGRDPIVGVRYTATFTESGKSIAAMTDEYVIGHGTSEITVTFDGLDAVFPASVETQAMDRLAARLRSAGSG